MSHTSCEISPLKIWKLLQILPTSYIYLKALCFSKRKVIILVKKNFIAFKYFNKKNVCIWYDFLWRHSSYFRHINVFYIQIIQHLSERDARQRRVDLIRVYGHSAGVLENVDVLSERRVLFQIVQELIVIPGSNIVSTFN